MNNYPQEIVDFLFSSKTRKGDRKQQNPLVKFSQKNSKKPKKHKKGNKKMKEKLIDEIYTLLAVGAFALMMGYAVLGIFGFWG